MALYLVICLEADSVSRRGAKPFLGGESRAWKSCTEVDIMWQSNLAALIENYLMCHCNERHLRAWMMWHEIICGMAGIILVKRQNIKHGNMCNAGIQLKSMAQTYYCMEWQTYCFILLVI